MRVVKHFVDCQFLFQNPKMFSNIENTPPLKPRQIMFTSKSTNDTNLVQNSVQTPLMLSEHFSNTNTTKNDSLENDESKAQLKEEIEYLKLSLEDKEKLVNDVTTESKQLKEKFDVEKEALSKEIDALHVQIDNLQSKVETIEAELVSSGKNLDKKSGEFDLLSGKLSEERANVEVIKQQLSSMENTIKFKDELIVKLQKDILNYNEIELLNQEEINRLKRENVHLKDSKDDTDHLEINQQLREELASVKALLSDTEQELSEKMIAYEKCLLDIKEQEKKIFNLTDILTDSKTARSVEEMRIEMRAREEENQRLKNEIQSLFQRLSVQREQSVDNPEKVRIQNVEQKLDFSSCLDESILKTIDEKDDETDNENDDEIETLRNENKELLRAVEKLQNTMESDREKFNYVRQQDANCIDVMQKRLEAAIDNENEIMKLLEEERNKTSKLSTKMLEHQFERARLSSSNLSLNESPIASPRRLIKGGESDQELLKCQNDEIKLLKSQLEREKERAVDMEKALSREKSRFEKELSEQKGYGDRMKDDFERIIRENKILQDELDDAQEK